MLIIPDTKHIMLDNSPAIWQVGITEPGNQTGSSYELQPELSESLNNIYYQSEDINSHVFECNKTHIDLSSYAGSKF